MSLRLVPDDDVPAGERLLGYAQAWREAVEIADAYRDRLRKAVLEDVATGTSVAEAARLTGLSRVTLHDWLRDGNN